MRERNMWKWENMPHDVIDWVLIEARNQYFPETILEQKAALLLRNGNIVGIEQCMLDQGSGVIFKELDAGLDYHFSIKTRHHLAVITKNAVTVPNEFPIDFSDPIRVKGGAGQLKDLDRGFYVLKAGDYNSDGIISVDDYMAYKGETAELNQYLDADFSCDGIVTVTDFNQMTLNMGTIGAKEIRY